MTKTPTILGHVPCPICPETAQVRPDKNGLAYIYCATGCYTQVFTRDEHRDGLLRARMRPAAEAVAASFRPSEAAPLGLPVPVPPEAVVQPSPPKPRNTWLTTLLDTSHTK